MSRRDTIIIAVLLNAGILAILFMLAVNEKEVDIPLLPPTQQIAQREQIKIETKPQPIEVSSSEEFIDFNIDDSSFASSDDSYLSFGQYGFSNEIQASPPVKQIKESTFSPPTQQQAEPYTEITVKRGDSLDKIARTNGTTIEALKKANNLRSDTLNIGQVLKVPAGIKAVVMQKSPDIKKAAVDSNGATYYTMKTGDSPWKIAKQNNMNVDDLLKLNNLDDEKARNLKVGDKIRIK